MLEPSNYHVFLAAKLVITQHGHSAVRYASGRIDEHEELGDTDGAKVWRRIKRAIQDLLIVKPKGTLH